MKIAIFWFRRDLRLRDNTGLKFALDSGVPVMPIFIFDTLLLNELEPNDPRVTFIYSILSRLADKIQKHGGGLQVLKGRPYDVFVELINKYDIAEVYANKDYEPYGLTRDSKIEELLAQHGVILKQFKDHVIFAEDEVTKQDATPYTVYTPYKRTWLGRFNSQKPGTVTGSNFGNFYKAHCEIPPLSFFGFIASSVEVREYNLHNLNNYTTNRDIPAKDNTTYLGPHLRFGTIGVRELIHEIDGKSEILLNEIIWREFFMQILFHFPQVVTQNFRSKYDGIKWRNREEEFELWCAGNTGFPLVDAGMRQLNQTGYMHNRVRMVAAGFLCKNLLIDWRWGEAYFAKKLLDYELSSNNGNWQWAAGTGCDAAPYFRIFNPDTQLKRFDPNYSYVKRWIPDYNCSSYCQPIVDYNSSRKRAIETYRNALRADNKLKP